MQVLNNKCSGVAHFSCLDLKSSFRKEANINALYFSPILFSEKLSSIDSIDLGEINHTKLECQSITYITYLLSLPIILYIQTTNSTIEPKSLYMSMKFNSKSISDIHSFQRKKETLCKESRSTYVKWKK
jgi:hypothetical protein